MKSIKDSESEVPMLNYYSNKNNNDNNIEEGEDDNESEHSNEIKYGKNSSIEYGEAEEEEEEFYLNGGGSRINNINNKNNNNNNRNFSGRFKRSGWIIISIFLSGLCGIFIGGSSHSLPRRPDNVLISMGSDSSSECNPYEQPGILKTDLSRPEGNMWEPIFAPASCQTTDWVTRLRNGKDVPFAKDKLIVIYGDSVDRGHNEDVCNFIGGKREMIPYGHAFSPLYPKGYEFTHPGYENHEYGESKTWPDNPQSRPYLCTLESHNLHILNVFHYGYLPVDGFINHHPHYYPPGVIEDRIDDIIVPMVAKITEAFSLHPVPALVSISPGFWDILRLSIEKNELRNAAIREGMSEEDARRDVRWDRFQVMNEEKRDFFKRRIEETIRHLANAWESESSRKTFWAPRILYRSLHHVQFFDDIPYVQVQALDQIGKAVVSKLILEGTPFMSKLLKLNKRISNLVVYVTRGAEDIQKSVKLGLGRRLKLDEWGILMLGQENHFKDPIHPAALPGSYLYGNALFTHLKLAVEAEG